MFFSVFFRIGGLAWEIVVEMLNSVRGNGLSPRSVPKIRSTKRRFPFEFPTSSKNEFNALLRNFTKTVILIVQIAITTENDQEHLT